MFYFCEARILKHFLLKIRVTINLLFSRAAWYAKYLGPWANAVYPWCLGRTWPQHRFSVCYTATHLSLLQQSLHLEGETSAAQLLSSSDPKPLKWKKKDTVLHINALQNNHSQLPIVLLAPCQSLHTADRKLCASENQETGCFSIAYWRWWPHIPVGPQKGWGTQNWWVCKEHCSNLLKSHAADRIRYWQRKWNCS